MDNKQNIGNININHNYYNTNILLNNKKYKFIDDLLLINVEPPVNKNKLIVSADKQIKNVTLNKSELPEKNKLVLKKRISYISATCIDNKRESVFENLIPCTNCGSAIKIDDIELHSDKCLIVKEDVIVSEISENPLLTIDFKLIKLEESARLTLKIVKKEIDNDYLLQLISFLNKGKQNDIEINILNELYNQINKVLDTYSGSFQTMILIERAKLLIKQKNEIIKCKKKETQYVKSNTIQKRPTKAKAKVSERVNNVVITKPVIINTPKITIEVKNEAVIKESVMEEATKETKVDIYENELITNKFKSMLQTKIQQNQIENEVEPSGSDTKELNKENDAYINKSNTPRLQIDPQVIESFSKVQSFSSNNETNNLNETAQNIIDMVFLTPNVIKDINSIVSLNQNNISQTLMTSMSNSNTLGGTNNRFTIISNKLSNGHLSNENQKYKAFCSLVLKIKFEQLSDNHPGLKMSEKLLWEESSLNNIEPVNWKDFILKEMNSKWKEKYYVLNKNNIKSNTQRFSKQRSDIVDIISQEI